MRVLLATSTFLPGVGGAEVAIHNLAEGLVSLGHEVAVCAVQRRPRREHERTYELFRFTVPRGIGQLGLYSRWTTGLLRRVVRAWRPVVLHAHFAWPTGHAAIRCREQAGVPVVLTCHGEDIQRRPGIGYGYRLRPGLDASIRDAVCGADALIAVGSEVHGEYIAMGVSESRIVDLPNAIHWERLAAGNPGARSQLGLPARRPVILAVGRNHPKKGFVALVHAMQAVIREHPGALCSIVGRDVPELAPLVRELGLTDHVRLHGEVLPVGVVFPDEGPAAQDRVEAHYHAADIYAMPSLVESAGIVTVEAMAAGLPVVARRAAGSEDLVLHGETGLLVDDGEAGLARALGGLLGDDASRLRMGAAARVHARGFDRVAVASRHVGVYERCLQR